MSPKVKRGAVYKKILLCCYTCFRRILLSAYQTILSRIIDGYTGGSTAVPPGIVDDIVVCVVDGIASDSVVGHGPDVNQQTETGGGIDRD